MKIYYLETAFILLHLSGTGSISLLGRSICLQYQTCQQDSDCQDDLICSCSANCERVCKSRGEDDSQEFALKQRTYRLFGIPFSCDNFPSCSSNSDCPGQQECQCHELCGAKCMTRKTIPPVHEGQCPQVSAHLFPCRRHECEYDQHCEKHEKCCPTLCSGKKCQRAVNDLQTTVSVTTETSRLSTPQIASCVNFTQLHSFISMNESLFTCQRSRCLQKRSHLPVCGTNGITFTNICRLIIANRTTSIPINMAYRGPCDGRATCHGTACSTGPQLNWEWINGRIQGRLKDLNGGLKTPGEIPTNEKSLTSSELLSEYTTSGSSEVP
ncbi:uncharacterized protein [Apostichopus japonicus]|uniref:uncharacterized protein isoform X1 n=1 Tax=Stichopus japonicus TaxID=307972 RepID=UPI003AB5D63E